MSVLEDASDTWEVGLIVLVHEQHDWNNKHGVMATERRNQPFGKTNAYMHVLAMEGNLKQ